MVSQSAIIQAVQEHPGCTVYELSMVIIGHADTMSSEFTTLRRKMYRMRGKELESVRKDNLTSAWWVKE